MSNKPTVYRPGGMKEWRNSEGQLHRDNDKPAVIYPNGHYYWYQNGKQHRDNDLPAIIWSDSYCQWWIDGELIKGQKCIPKEVKEYIKSYRKENRMSNKPTVCRSDGTQVWRNSKGQLHRDGDLPALIYPNGRCDWWQNGLVHRDNDLPARIWSDGWCEWWENAVFIKGQKCSPKKIKEYMKQHLVKQQKEKGKETMKKLTPAQKAVRTRQARKQMMDLNPDAYCVAEDMASDISTFDTACFLGLSVGSVAAYKANVTRGTYGKLLEDCNL